MRVRIAVLTVAHGLVFAGVALAAEYYRLDNVRRVDQDRYRDGNLYVQTRFCYHYTDGEEAILKWEGPGLYGNKVIWEDDSSMM
jgi:hypothetical protein